LGIIGLGNMGYGHMGNINAGRVPDVELTAVCDLDEGKRERALLDACADEARLQHLTRETEEPAHHRERTDGEDVSERAHATGVTPFFRMMLPYLRVSPVMTIAYAFFARS